MRLLLAVVLMALLGGCATGPAQTGRPPSTLSDLLLALDASEKMAATRAVAIAVPYVVT